MIHNTDKPSFRHIAIVGAGAIGTALAQAMSANALIETLLISIEKDVVESINSRHINSRYFPGFRLSPRVKATLDVSDLVQSGIILLAIPSAAVPGYVKEIAPLIRPGTVLVNLAKGFGPDRNTISESLMKDFDFPVAAMKGPSFARELINGSPTAFTIGCKDSGLWPAFEKVFEDTPVYLDFTKDIRGVELLSILKNIYAIAIGMLDAQFNTANLRFLFLTRALNEMRAILLMFGGKKPTIFKYCGFGDFGLTALNDLSRNRTLGLLIGKGFFTEQISEKVLLEGKVAVNVFCGQIMESRNLSAFPIMAELYKVFNQPYEVGDFVRKMLQK
jgi:glycerol-3-phosphate dehydrogenase (NAD(P)+)